ncbi:MAG: lytic murein transglycosylase [Gemmatimonadaceae bacterium]|nr:lytic murein transglycosylase [Gemmatimonadaceae bacterium]
MRIVLPPTVRWSRALAAAGCIAASALPAFAAAPPSFASCIESLRASRAARSIRPATWDTHIMTLRPDSTVLTALNAQPEFTLAIWDYFAIMADGERITEGQRLMRTHRALLDQIAATYAVDPAVVLAIWGVESNFGAGRGNLSVLRSLSTLACIGRRQSYFRGELIAALRIVQEGHIDPAHFKGSWAGAFGHTQFMPGTFEWLAVDHDGDGRRDVVDNVGDALASTANFLKRAGRWREGEPWGVEVQLPAGYVGANDGRRTRRTLATWSTKGLRRVDGTPLQTLGLPKTTTAALLRPAGTNGPAFLVLNNFFAVFRYNASESYALAIAHLSDRIRGGRPLVATWPTDDLGLSRADRRELHTLLASRGYNVGATTAALTPSVVSAIRDEQARLGFSRTGRPGQRLLNALRSSN